MGKISLCIALLACSVPAWAGFSQPVQSVNLTHGQQQTTVVFEADSAITSAKAHCDCTTLSISGNKLVARVDTSKFDASVDKTITAATADGKSTTLTMRFRLPDAVIFSASTLVWKQGSAPTPQVLRITVPAGSPITAVKEAALSGEDFYYKAAKGERKGEYTVTITPKSTSKRVRNRLVIRMQSADPRFTQRIIYLRVAK